MPISPQRSIEINRFTLVSAVKSDTFHKSQGFDNN